MTTAVSPRTPGGETVQTGLRTRRSRVAACTPHPSDVGRFDAESPQASIRLSRGVRSATGRDNSSVARLPVFFQCKLQGAPTEEVHSKRWSA